MSDLFMWCLEGGFWRFVGALVLIWMPCAGLAEIVRAWRANR